MDLRQPGVIDAPIPHRRRNALLLAGGLVLHGGMIQLAVALGTVTIVAVTGTEGILGLGPAVYLLSGALAVAPAGRLSDSVGRITVIRGGYVLGVVGPVLTAAGCAADAAPLAFAGLALAGAAHAIVLLSRTAAAEMFPPERRARALSVVLFGVVFGAIWGPLVFGPMFAGKHITTEDLVRPWLVAALFPLAGLVVTLFVRMPPEQRTRQARSGRVAAAREVSLTALLVRPGVVRAMVAAGGSYLVMAGVMNLAGYVAVGHGHQHGAVFTIISLHIVGMYGLVLVVGELVERIGRRTAMTGGLLTMAVSNLSLVWLEGIVGLSLSMFGLGLGWCFAYVAGSTEIVDLASPVERGRLVGTTDLSASVGAAVFAIGGGALYGATDSVVPLALLATALSLLGAVVVGSTRGRDRLRRPEPAVEAP
ncbi:MAG: MFS transporter [Gaiella sp.]